MARTQKIEVLFLAVALTACVSPTMRQNVSYELDNCTEKFNEYHSVTIPYVPRNIQERAIKEATIWATENCYLPCQYRMCGSITEYNEDIVSVYISYPTFECGAFEESTDDVKREFVNPEEDLEYVIVCLGPESEVTYSISDFEIVGEKIWHSGCNKDCYEKRQ